MKKVIEYVRRHNISISLTILQGAVLILVGALLGPYYKGEALILMVILIGAAVLLERKITEAKNKE